jgi:acid stress-induced BolA-like protein IbaG/YrbA
MSALIQQIESALRHGLDCEKVVVDGDGHHFNALVVSRDFEGRTRLERHRLVYAALGDRMREEIHALSMRTLTPQEAASGAA